MKLIPGKFFEALARVGVDPSDDDDLRIKKTLLVVCSFPFMVSGFLWGAMYIEFGEVLSGIIPIGYAVISFFTLIHFSITHRYRFFRFSQLGLILLLPFLLMLTLGGFISGSAVILWSFICPLGAMLFEELNRSFRWFVAFMIIIILSGLLQPWLNGDNHLPHDLRIVFFVMNILGVGSLVYFMVFYFVRQKNLFQERSEILLLNILPKEIAAILKRETRVIADHYDGASILFADVVGFTPLSSSLTPIELVELLNEVFSHFDSLVERYQLEKIKTIGDCYMVASGVPRPRADHAQVLVAMALEMQEYIREHTFIDGKKLEFRIGINSGPVVAGIIGRKKFIYDLWGDAVNTASRMESHGKGGSIQITRTTYDLVHTAFQCDPQGTVTVKGKGVMDVWHVIGKNS